MCQNFCFSCFQVQWFSFSRKWDEFIQDNKCSMFRCRTIQTFRCVVYLKRRNWRPYDDFTQSHSECFPNGCFSFFIVVSRRELISFRVIINKTHKHVFEVRIFSFAMAVFLCDENLCRDAARIYSGKRNFLAFSWHIAVKQLRSIFSLIISCCK